jgi:hypothetical protein
VASIIEPGLHFDAVVLSRGIIFLHRLQHVNLNLRRISVFLNITDDLDGAVASEFPVPTLEYSSERTLTEWCQDFVHGRDVFAELVLQMTVLWKSKKKGKK